MCAGIGRAHLVSTEGHAMPPQHHQHSNGQGQILCRLIVSPR
ncbi:hypothetical protein [Janthinobacterium lividum]|nr:hypothetical protein [Janthinobacterium lividum]